MTRPFLAVTIAAVTVWGAPAFAADDAIPGSQVVAKASGDAIVIWDASPLLATLLEQKLSDEKNSAQLELLATKILIAKAPDLVNAKTITTKVVYVRTGAVSPIYRTATLTGVERLLTVAASRADLTTHAAEWLKSVEAGTLPAGVTATVTGKYPH